MAGDGAHRSTEFDWSRQVPRALAIALAALAPAATAWPSQQAASYARAHAEVDAGRFAEAVAMLEELTAREPRNGNAWHLLGYAYQAQKDYARALPAYLEAMKFPGSAPHAYYNAACVHALEGDKDRAFQYLRQAEATGAFDLAQMDGDADLESLRGDPRYAELRPPAEVFADPFVEPVRVLHEWRGEAALGQFGWIARNAGDVDGDGANDVVTSAPTLAAGSTAPGRPGGRVYLYSSRSGQLLWQRDGAPGEQLGLGVEAAGDVNADGTPDVIAGAPGSGHAYVYSGADGAVLLELQGKPSEAFGRSVSDVGDVDGDGHADVLVGAPLGSAGKAGAGHSAVHSGQTGELLLLFSGERAGDRFGSVGAGWSGGQEAWIAIGAPNAGEGQRGRVYVYDGQGAARFAIDAGASGAELGGMFVSIVGDVDGDGVRDVYGSDWSDTAVGTTTTGRIYVHSGASGERLWSAAGQVTGEGFGIGPADAGDLDGDGLDDLVVGAWQHASAAPSGGRVSFLSGKDGAPLGAITCKVPGDTFGFDATGMGDVDGDGHRDFLLTSAWSGVNGTRSGRTFLIAGTALGGL